MGVRSQTVSVPGLGPNTVRTLCNTSGAEATLLAPPHRKPFGFHMMGMTA